MPVKVGSINYTTDYDVATSRTENEYEEADCPGDITVEGVQVSTETFACKALMRSGGSQRREC